MNHPISSKTFSTPIGCLLAMTSTSMMMTMSSTVSVTCDLPLEVSNLSSVSQLAPTRIGKHHRDLRWSSKKKKTFGCQKPFCQNLLLPIHSGVSQTSPGAFDLGGAVVIVSTTSFTARIWLPNRMKEKISSLSTASAVVTRKAHKLWD